MAHQRQTLRLNSNENSLPVFTKRQPGDVETPTIKQQTFDENWKFNNFGESRNDL